MKRMLWFIGGVLFLLLPLDGQSGVESLLQGYTVQQQTVAAGACTVINTGDSEITVMGPNQIAICTPSADTTTADTTTPPATDPYNPPAEASPTLPAGTQVFSNTSPYPGQPIGSQGNPPAGTICTDPIYTYGGKTYYTLKFTDASGHSRTGIALCQ